MCKPFPPPLVRGGVFLVGLETKYRVIADGNIRLVGTSRPLAKLETKYRVIADGNLLAEIFFIGSSFQLETKYRVIADGN